MPAPSPRPSPAADDHPEDDPRAKRSRDRRMVVIVEAFLRQVRQGGSLDPEPFLESAEELREDLEPLLRGVLRLEQLSEGFESKGRRAGDDPASPEGGGAP